MNNNYHTFSVKVIANYLKIFCLLIICYLLFALAACLLPNNAIKQNINESVDYLAEIKDYPRAIIQEERARMDNFTDALILNQAYYMNRDHLIESMLVVPRARLKNQMTETLQRAAKEYVVPEDIYPRYWHGNTFLARFLLLITDYNGIRFILYIFSSLLFLILCCRLFPQAGWSATIVFFISFVLFNVYVLQFSIQFFPVLALSLLASIILCRKLTNFDSVLLLFFVFGSLTAYFDLLTTPILTLGVPLSVYLILMCPTHENQSLLLSIKNVLLISLVWAASFAVTWVSKWVIATLFTPYNVIRDGLDQFLLRAQTEIEFSRLDAISHNMSFVPWLYVILILLALLLLAVFCHRSKGWKNSVLFALPIFFPYVWYFITANHSYLHWWFTYRAQLFSIICLFMAFVSLVDWAGLQKKCNRLFAGR